MTSSQAFDKSAETPAAAESLGAAALGKFLSALPGMAYQCSVAAPWTVDYVSEGVLSLSGYESRVLTSGILAWGDIVHPHDLERITAEVDAAVAERCQFTLTYRILCKSGEEKWVFERGEALYNSEGQPLSLVGFIGDFTEQRAIEHRRQQGLAQASGSAAMDTMASTLAHELNQPLTAAIGWIWGSEKLLQRGPQFAEQALEGLRQTSASVLRAAEIIKRVRKMVATGDASTDAQYLAPIVEESLLLTSEQARKAGVSCKVEIPELCVEVDRIQLQQIIHNLVRNAIEAMGNSADKELKITARKVKECAEVSVTDTGTGLAPEVRDQLFIPFHSTKKRGLGVGLSLCRTIVEAHNGKIWTDENPGGGTIFQFTIPLAGSASP